MSEAHASLLNRLAATVVALHPTRIIRVAIDGVDGAGKTTLADALAPLVAAQGRPTIRASVDDFHHPRSVRYARGRYSPDGFFLDSYDYDSFRTLLLDPLSPGSSGRYVARRFDLDNDRPFGPVTQQAPPTAALIVDGIFLHRPELRACWDLSIFLKVDFNVSVPRGARRGPDFGTPDPAAPPNQRYVGGQQRYLRECAPEEHADIVIGYNDLREPRILKWRASPS
ncbi:uridine kinase [Bradyrhizobium sp. AUGA SZCCT0182]|uniref:uridine kinase n=1 Tax=Bradyrhizobium sp. AUGA SZCCT0182 TaxID=2807667 RepID=UPI00289FE65E|nr:uridine kinase [Bradyrhizobium sp. AUGA SZCCT0182]